MLIQACEPCCYSPEGLLGVFFPAEPEVQGGALLLAPLFEERRSAHRALTEFCQALALRGISVLHPDLSGCGNSPGSLREGSLSQWRRDLEAARDWLRRRVPAEHYYLIGCRLGALLAGWYLASEPGDWARVLLWNPVTSGATYLSAARKRRLIQDSLTESREEGSGLDPHEVEGQILSEGLHRELKEQNLAEQPRLPGVRLFQCSFNLKLTSDAQRLVQAWGEDVPVQCLVAPPFWNAHSPMGYDALVSEAAAWLLQNP